MEAFLATLGEEVQDAYEETFNLFTNATDLADLGMLNPNADSIELSIAGRDFTVTQSPGLLQSKQKHGTTGAAVWQTSVKLAGWLASPKNVLFRHGVLDASSTVLELGAGMSGIVASTLAPRVRAVVATDQQHLLKLLRANLDANAATPPRAPLQRRAKSTREYQQIPSITTLALDWEEDDVPKHLTSHGLGFGVDLVVASDCIYNYALIEPFVQACVEVCSLQGSVSRGGKDDRSTTLCLVANQLRQSEVFEQWLDAFMRSFRVWQVPSESLTPGFEGGGGFAVHVGVLR